MITLLFVKHAYLFWTTIIVSPYDSLPAKLPRFPQAFWFLQRTCWRSSAGSLVTACPRQTSSVQGDLGIACQPGIIGKTKISLRSARCPWLFHKCGTIINVSAQKTCVDNRTSICWIWECDITVTGVVNQSNVRNTCRNYCLILTL